MIDEVKHQQKIDQIYGARTRFDDLQRYDFPEAVPGAEVPTYIVQYDDPLITLEEISGSLGTRVRPNPDPKKDPPPPTPKEQISPSKLKEDEKTDEKDEEDGADEGDEAAEDDADAAAGGDGDDPGAGLIEEEEEEYTPPVDVIIYYDFGAFNGRDPILLA
jgi:hypothetical protein